MYFFILNLCLLFQAEGHYGDSETYRERCPEKCPEESYHGRDARLLMEEWAMQPNARRSLVWEYPYTRDSSRELRVVWKDQEQLGECFLWDVDVLWDDEALVRLHVNHDSISVEVFISILKQVKDDEWDDHARCSMVKFE